jgi:hypothetical protein
VAIIRDADLAEARNGTANCKVVGFRGFVANQDGQNSSYITLGIYKQLSEIVGTY